MLKQLPIGRQTFRDVIEENNLYIDKTKIALELISSHKYVFLSRPRRFGKSLFLDTLKNIFEGNEALFKGLYIHDHYDWTEQYPVIKIGFGGVRSPSELKQSILAILKENKFRLKISAELQSKDYALCFRELIQLVYNQYQRKVVILIDEYDKPILDNLDQLDVAKENREILKRFYTEIKVNDEYLKFAFLTGVSKFSKVSIFSGLNNLTDISLQKKYGNICGYTQHDIETAFIPYLSEVDLEKLRLWYNGYNFLGNKVYNPFDILLFIDGNKLFKNYWFETGTPEFLINLIKAQNYFVPALENFETDESMLNSFDIENINIETVLFQTGYLTIKQTLIEDDFINYKLGFPNKEVRSAFNNSLSNIFINKTQKRSIRTELIAVFKNAELNTLEEIIKRLFANIAYNNFTNNNIANYEGFYASVLYSCFASLGIELIPEDVTNQGRIDLTVKFADKTYIFEFKVTAEPPLQQVKAKRYYEKYSGKVFIIGIVFNKKTRNITHFEWEKITYTSNG